MGRPKVALDPSCVWQPDLEATALAALLRVPKGGRSEHAGVLYKDANGNYCYSTSAPGDPDSFNISAAIPEGTSLAGTYHNHPQGAAGDGDSRMFSPNDVSVAKNLGVPSFIRADRDGGVRSFTPGKTGTSTSRRAGMIYETSAGDPIAESLATQAIVAALRNPSPPKP